MSLFLTVGLVLIWLALIALMIWCAFANWAKYQETGRWGFAVLIVLDLVMIAIYVAAIVSAANGQRF